MEGSRSVKAFIVNVDIQQVAIAITGLTTVAVSLKPAFGQFRKMCSFFVRQEVAKDNVSNLIQLQTINDQMWNIENHVDSAFRVLLFAGHNCGGLPSMEKPYYITQIGKAIAHDQKHLVGDYSKVTAGSQYVDMLLDLYKRKEITFNTDDQRDGQLKDYYVGEGITESLIFFLRITVGNAFVYMSVATKKPNGFTSEDKSLIRHMVTKIQSSANKLR